MPHTRDDYMEFPIEFQVVDVPAIVDIQVCGKSHFERARERDWLVMAWLDGEAEIHV